MRTNKAINTAVVGVLVMSGWMGLKTQVHAGSEDRGVDEYGHPVVDSVKELKIQDSAFALLVETYRQYKSCEIEKNYQRRIEAAKAKAQEQDALVFAQKSPAMKNLQEYVAGLARAERDLEMETVQTQMVNLSNTYNHMRKLDEERLGQTVTNSASLRAAAEQLKSFVIVANGPLKSPSASDGTSLPAGTVLLDADEVMPSPNAIIDLANNYENKE